MSEHYVIKDGHIIEADLLEAQDWLKQDSNRIIALYIFEGVKVSTVFLGTDETCGHGDQRKWFETILSGTDEEDVCCGYETLAEAKIGHMQFVRTLISEVE